jgi:hypothetical protein
MSCVARFGGSVALTFRRCAERKVLIAAVGRALGRNLRLHGRLQPFFDQTWGLGEIEPVN